MLYTVIFEIDGGTFIEQIDAPNDDLKNLMNLWAETVCRNYTFDWLKDKKSLLLEVNDPDTLPVLLDGLKNAWCTGLTVGGKFGLMNIVKTVE